MKEVINKAHHIEMMINKLKIIVRNQTAQGNNRKLYLDDIPTQDVQTSQE